MAWYIYVVVTAHGVNNDKVFSLKIITIFTYLFIKFGGIMAHLQSSVFKLSKDLIDSIHEEGIVAYTS